MGLSGQESEWGLGGQELGWTHSEGIKHGPKLQHERLVQTLFLRLGDTLFLLFLPF